MAFVGSTINSSAICQTPPEELIHPDSLVTVYFPGDLPVQFRLIPRGTFMMGSEPEDAIGAAGQEHERDESPMHQVTISKDFYLGVYEVTQAQWVSVMGSNPAVFQQIENYIQEHEDPLLRPVESVSWDDCQVFIARLHEMGVGKFRLPTEAEWEYACRAGTSTRYYWGNDPRKWIINQYAWVNSRSFASTHPVGQKKPNSWGLFDMSGNVWEWCSDWYGPYSPDHQIDPRGLKSGSRKVFRGGSWFDFPDSQRSANRHAHGTKRGYPAIGLRLVLEVD
jgi:formylglycine-generating enzyme required for sulfatase activity